MKKLLLGIAIAAISILKTNAQDYAPMLTTVFTTFDSTSLENMPQRMELSNKLGLIAKKYPDEWVPHYYNAYSKVMLSYLEKDEAKRDAYLNEADNEYSTMIDLVKTETSETNVLAAMIANGRLAVNPRSRYQKYGKIFDQHLDKAKELNPDNPRIYYLRGTSKFYTPKMFGGGKKASRPYFEKAAELFAKETTTNIATPHWGIEVNNYYLKESGGEEAE